ncbi:MAG: hypothetical protein PHG90_03720 [Clostridia bacterium]|nr:hypothetical protein [Clostridia bacterium]
MGKVIVINKYTRTPEGFMRIDCTSGNRKWAPFCSPFRLGPVQCYAGLESKNMENAWQFSKVYADQVDANGDPTPEYFEWRDKGYSNPDPIRHPHEGKPLYIYWNGEKYGYIEARKKVYIPLYANAFVKGGGYKMLKDLLKDNNIALADFDGYDFKALGLSSYEDVINYEKRSLAHAFIIAMLLEKDPAIAPYFNLNSI